VLAINVCLPESRKITNPTFPSLVDYSKHIYGILRLPYYLVICTANLSNLITFIILLILLYLISIIYYSDNIHLKLK